MTRTLHQTGITILACLAIGLSSSPATAAEYFIGPSGSDSNSGGSAARPLGTFEQAIAKLSPGDTLTLLDGVYDGSNTGYPYIRCGRNAKNGAKGQPITLRAQHERQAHIAGDGTNPGAFNLLDCSFWNIRGIHASSSNHQGGASEVVKIARSDHIIVRRLLANHDNRYMNTSILGITQSHHILAEEIELYDFHRHGFSAYQSDHITLRRSFIHARGASDIDGGWGSHKCCKDGGDEGISFYYTSNSIVENTITADSEQLSVISGRDTVLGNLGGRHNKLLGSISYHDLRPSFFQSRIKEPDSKSAADMVIQDFLAVGAKREAMTVRGVQDFTLAGATFYDTEITPLFFLGSASGKLVGGRHYYPGCEYWTCKNKVRNTLFYNVGNPAIDESKPSKVGRLDWFAEGANAWSNGGGFGTAEGVGDGAGRYRQSLETEPTHMGLDGDECLVFVPEDSNMGGAGKGGADIGANILYRYEDGDLTDEPLWDPDTGEFPCGAVVAGVNDIPGKSCFDIHKQLNVNQNGCQLPYGDGAGPVQPPLKDVSILAPRATSEVVVDGALTETIYTDVFRFEDPNAASDNTTRLSMGWNDQWLYAGIEVDDANIDIDAEVAPWLSDSVEMFIDPHLDRSSTPLADDLKPLVVADGTTVVSTAPNGLWRSITHNAKLRRAVVDTDDGYRVEMAIGWVNLAVNPQIGDTLGLLLANNDRDAGETHRFSFNGTTPFSTPSNWGRLKLVDQDGADPGRPADAGVDSRTTAETDAGRTHIDSGPPHTALGGNGRCSTPAHQGRPIGGWAGLLVTLGVLGVYRRSRHT